MGPVERPVRPQFRAVLLGAAMTERSVFVSCTEVGAEANGIRRWPCRRRRRTDPDSIKDIFWANSKIAPTTQKSHANILKPRLSGFGEQAKKRRLNLGANQQKHWVSGHSSPATVAQTWPVKLVQREAIPPNTVLNGARRHHSAKPTSSARRSPPSHRETDETNRKEWQACGIRNAAEYPNVVKVRGVWIVRRPVFRAERQPHGTEQDAVDLRLRRRRPGHVVACVFPPV